MLNLQVIATYMANFVAEIHHFLTLALPLVLDS